MNEPPGIQKCPRLLTVTWSGDLAHFRLLRESLRQSALVDCPHEVIVQQEDLALFEPFRADGVLLRSTAEVLPEKIEHRRRQARRHQLRWGRRGTKLAGSVARRCRWPRWPRYTGWHTQQLCKLMAASSAGAETVVVLDSDVVVTRHARTADFLPTHPGTIRCIQDWQPADAVSRKAAHWQATAHRLLRLPEPRGARRDVYYDTPFVFDAAALQALLAWLEQQYRQPWWRTLIASPPRQWSEFGLYRAWLRYRHEVPVEWLDRSLSGYVYDASDVARLEQQVRALIDGQQCHYVTIHSQSNGRGDWGPENYAEALRSVLSGR